MLFDRNSYEAIIMFIKENILDLFNEEMELKKECVEWNRMNYFKLEYNYMPSDYMIEIENEGRLFTISITDSEGAQNTLQRIEKFNNSLGQDNIRNALVTLKRILIENKFKLYVFKNDKIYRKNNNQLVRVKDVHDM